MIIRRVIASVSLVAISLALSVGAALGQATQDVSGALDANEAKTTGIDQIGSQRARTGRTEQLSPMRDAAAHGAQQLTSERKSTASGPQLYRGGRTAQSPTPLSTHADGKPQGTVRLVGNDRCDPKTGADAGKAACSNVIESRADEFHRPTPPTLSPEQKLLIGENIRERGSLDMLVRKVGRNDMDADASETQGLASVVLAPAPPPEKPTDADAAAGQDTGALVQAIIDTMNSAPQH